MIVMIKMGSSTGLLNGDYCKLLLSINQLVEPIRNQVFEDAKMTWK